MMNSFHVVNVHVSARLRDIKIILPPTLSRTLIGRVVFREYL